MRASALVLDAPRQLRLTELELPEIGDDDALLRIEACGLCGTDHEQYSGHLRAEEPFIPGHEIVGTIEVAGSTASARWKVRPGDRVAVEVFLSCRSCPHCNQGVYRRCERWGVRRMHGFTPVSHAPGLWGGYATHLYLHPDALVLPVPTTLDPVLATVFNPLGAGIRWAATLPQTKAGDVVAVLGPGIRGLCAAAAAKEAGAAFVMITGVGPRDADRLALAAAFGADLAVDVATTDPVRALRDATGRLADTVVDVTAKAPAALGQAVRLAALGGTLVLAGTRGSEDTPGFHPDHVVYKELTIIGALGVDFPAYEAALALLATNRYPFATLPRAAVGLDGAERLLRSMAGESDEAAPVHGVITP